MNKNLVEIIFEVEESPEGGYIAQSLGEAIFTEAETLDELRCNLREAVRCHFEDELLRPKVIRLHFLRHEVFAV